MEERSDIIKSFQNQTIFITGGTGFVGKVLIEKLLRLCDLNLVYILIRSKRNATAEQRFQRMFEKPCFAALKSKMPNIREKVRLIPGNCLEVGLGLRQPDKETLMKEVTIVIHSAANVSFAQSFRSAVNNNVRPLKEIIHLSKQISHLKAFIFVSTAYSNAPPRIFIKEQFYEPPIKTEALFSLVDVLDDKALNSLRPHLLKGWINTYAYSKNVAEDLLRTEGKGLPLAIVRPGIVHASMKDPLPGWADFIYGIIGVSLGMFLGVIRSLYCRLNVQLHVVPCDYVANNIIAVTWDVLTTKTRSLESDADNIPIYNLIGSEKNPLTLKMLKETGDKYKWLHPINSMLWFPVFNFTECLVWHNIRIFLFHTLVAYIVDFCFLCIGKKRIAAEKIRLLNEMLSLMHTYGTTQFYFDYTNVQNLWRRMNRDDHELFKFNMDDFSWEEFWMISLHNTPNYLVKDPTATVEKARRKIKIFAILHFSIIGIFWFTLLGALLCLFK